VLRRWRRSRNHSDALSNSSAHLLTVSIDKDVWIDLERKRWGKYFNIPMSEDFPPGFPINTISLGRVLAALSISHPQSVTSAISLLFQNFWVHYTEPTKPENLLALVKTIVGSEEEAKKVIEQSKSEEAKKLLTANTDDAFKDKAFGLPWFVGKCVLGLLAFCQSAIGVLT
jgi:2-hydroxychromene-2-carboxylate isomerase